MSTERKAANAVGGKTARACDNCILKRARWYCAADDAFLCQGCDASVHSANSLARRHERVRLKTASLKPNQEASSLENSLPPWQQGFTRKARTPRAHAKITKTKERMPNALPLVPEMGSEEASLDENEEQLLYRVPVFDPSSAELCTSTDSNKASDSTNDETMPAAGNQTKALFSDCGHEGNGDVDNLAGFLHSDMDLDEFAADVESLLGRGFDDDSFGMEGLGILDCKEDVNTGCSLESGKVKVEEGEEDQQEEEGVAGCHVDPELDVARETFDLNFDYDSLSTGEEEVEEKVASGAAILNKDTCKEEEEITGRLALRLDYEAVINDWAGQGSPWTNGDRPQLNPDECWSECMGLCAMEIHQPYGGGGLVGHVAVGGDGGREARVSRYREKRRTRLFSKKIRYEVRKLNAEKRPRMKGRFVKRASFAGPSAFSF